MRLSNTQPNQEPAAPSGRAHAGARGDEEIFGGEDGSRAGRCASPIWRIRTSGWRTTGGSILRNGLNQRLHDFLKSLDQAIDGAIAAKVDLVVFAGDIYKTRDPTPTHQREFARRIQRLPPPASRPCIVAGNHDIPMSAGRATSVDIFRALEVPSVTVARTIGTHVIETQAGPVQIVAFPWAVRSRSWPSRSSRTTPSPS